MSITFRKRPDHTVSLPPQAKEPHLDLHSIDERLADDDDIPVLLPEPSVASRPFSGAGVTGTQQSQSQSQSSSTHRATGTPDADTSATSVQHQPSPAVHIPAPANLRRPTPVHNTPAWEDSVDDVPVLVPTQHTTPVARPVSTEASSSPTNRPWASPHSHNRYDADPTASTAATSTRASAPISTATSPLAPATTSAAAASASTPSADRYAATSETETAASSPSLPSHPTVDDFTPFLNAARGPTEHHNKPELYVWSDDENDALSQAVRADFTLNRIQPTAGRPAFDAALFRAPSRPEALASSISGAAALSPSADSAADMQAEIDTLITELLDESHDYLKRRLLEEIPEIIAKYRRPQ